MSQKFETVNAEELDGVHGGLAMGSDAHFIMMKESSGRSWVKNPHSTAFGAFQMTVANRRKYMGRDYRSTDIGKQYAAASAYVRDRYGSWAGARRFWNRHHWY